MRHFVPLVLFAGSAAAQLFAHHDPTRHRASLQQPPSAPDAAELDRPPHGRLSPNDAVEPPPSDHPTTAASQESEEDILRGLFGASNTPEYDTTPTVETVGSLQTSVEASTITADPVALVIPEDTTSTATDLVATVALTRSRLRITRTAPTPTTAASTAIPDPESVPGPQATDSTASEDSHSHLSMLARAGITLGTLAGAGLLIALAYNRRRLARAFKRDDDVSWTAADEEKYQEIVCPAREPTKPPASFRAARPMTVLAAAPSDEIRLWEKLQYGALQTGWKAQPGDIVRQSLRLFRSESRAALPPVLTEMPPARRGSLRGATRGPGAAWRNDSELEEGVLRMLTR